jgi:hypothetical protein
MDLADRTSAVGVLVHGPEHQPAAAVELAVVDAGSRKARLDGDDRPTRAALKVENLEPAGEARQQRTAANRRKARQPVRQRHG